MKPVFPSETVNKYFILVSCTLLNSNRITCRGQRDCLKYSLKILIIKMYDPDINRTFTMSNSESKNPKWWLGNILL
jgi:hypothetical protein